MKVENLQMRMHTRAIIAALLILLGSMITLPVHRAAQAAVPRDVVVLLDVTRSMRGEGDDPRARNIWDQVRDHVVTQIDQLADGTSLMIVPFGSGPQYGRFWPQTAVTRPDVPANFASMDGGGRAEAKKFVAGREPDADATFICDSLDYALRQLDLRRQGSTQRIQTVYLYTDGFDNGNCQNNFTDQLARIFNGHAGDYPFLHTVYIDLNGYQTKESTEKLANGTNNGIVVTAGIADSFAVDATTLDLGNLYNKPDGVPVTVRLKSVPQAYADYALTAEILPAGSGLTIEPAEKTLAAEMGYTVKVGQPPPKAGSYSGTIRLRPTRGSYTFANDGSIAITYQYLAPTPVPATVASTIAPTPVPPAVPTVVPTATSPPVPTVQPTLVATATPRAKVVVDAKPPTDLGTVRAGGPALTGSNPVQIVYDKAAQDQKSSVDLVATLDGKEQPDRFWLVGQGGTHVTRLTVRPDGQGQLGYALPADGSRFFGGTVDGAAKLAATSPNADVQLTSSGTAAKELAYTYHKAYTTSPLLFILGLLVLLLVLLGGFVAAHARFPVAAEVVVAGGSNISLRPTSERGASQRYFAARKLSIGPYPDDVDVPGAQMTAAYLSPRRGGGDLFGKKTVLHPASTGMSDDGTGPGAPVTLGGVPLEKPETLHDGDTFTVDGTPLTYRASSGGVDTHMDSGFVDGEDGSAPRRGLFGRRATRQSDAFDSDGN